jgi:hypothetical protein
MNPSHLPCLSSLSIAVREVQQRDLDILGNLHALRRLDLIVGHMELGILGELVVGAGSFACLMHCNFDGFVTIDIRSSDGVGLDLGLGLLPSLHYIQFFVDYRGVSTEEGTVIRAILQHAMKIHPNHPRLRI